MTNRKIQYWVIPPDKNSEFVACMEDVLNVYSMPYDPDFPVLCMDEQPVQLLKETRNPIPATLNHPRRVDYEYERAGTASIFVFTEPLSGWRNVSARPRRTKVDWAIEMADLLDGRYANAKKVLLVCDNLNTHTKDISTLDLQDYKRKLQKSYSSAHRLNLHISIMKALFHWARKNDILEHIPNIDAISRGKIIHKQRATFSSDDITQLLIVTDVQMKAMIWLGLNCGFGCTDCGELQWKHLNLVKGRVVLPRWKTGIFRDLPLWPETIEALNDISRKGKLVFYTSRGNPFIRTVLKTDAEGQERYSTLNTISTKFSRLIKKSGLNVPKGTGFYTLRRTAATIAARLGDPFAVQRLLGHANLQMATRYVQDVSKQTDEVIEKSRFYVV